MLHLRRVELEVFKLEIDVGELLPRVVMQILRNVVEHLFLCFDDGHIERFLEIEVSLVEQGGVVFYFADVEFDEQEAK
jgi:hypothetical protein